MKTIKATFIMLVPILVLNCLSGCGGGDPNCVRVDTGRPFIAQEGFRYYIEEGGITYNFNQNAQPEAQVVYVDPGRCNTLQPGVTYVMLVDPTYLVRRQQEQASNDEAMESIRNWGDSLERSTKSFNDSTNKTMDDMQRGVRQMNRTNSQTLGILQGSR
jgi:hypothetical protein